MRHFFLSLLFLISFTGIAFAKAIEANKQANDFINAKKYKEAVLILNKQVSTKKFDNDTILLLGIAYSRLGEYDKAILYLEQAIKHPQGNDRVNLELGLAYYLQSEQDQNYKGFKKAKSYFITVKNKKDIPRDTLQKIEYHLKKIEQREEYGYPKNWQINASAGYMYDSNANAGTTENTVLMFNLPFVLSEDAKETSDDAYKYSLGLNYAKTTDSNWQVFGNIGVAQTDYRNLNNFDLVSLYSSGGIKYKKKNIIYSLPIAVNRLTVGHQDSYYNHTYGFNPSIAIEIGRNMVFNNQFVLQERRYKTVKTRDGNNITYRPNFKYYINQNHFFGIGGNIGKDNAEDDINSNTAYGLSLEYYKLFFARVSLYIAPYISKTNYKAKENAFDELREDRMYSLSSSLTYQFKGRRGFKPSLSLNYSFTKNDSNLPLYAYKRQQIGLELSAKY
jgi:outer membrane protein